MPPMFSSVRHVVLAAVLVAASAAAAEPSKAVAILTTRCFMCHDAAFARKAIVPGKPEESLLVRMIAGDKPGDKPRMPKQGAPLSPAEVGEIRSWIAQGAIWPETVLWSLQPLRKPPVPQTGNPIDAFVLAKLAEKKLTRSPNFNPT